jgi:hypothetical protein
LQFRIGKREQLANLDVFVFHVNPFLTPAELDAIFLSAPDADFDNDGLINCADVDALVATIAGATNDTTYDLTNDGLVNGDDLVMWLADAGAANLASGNPYLPGDANLDGVVNGADFIIWNNNKFQTAAAWCSGDFNADGFVNGADFIIWNNFKFTSSDIASVPEPATLASLFALLLGVAIGRRRAR